MDAELLKTCFREIGHIVFDANEKVTVRRISNTWSINNQQSVEVLQKWVAEQKTQKKLTVEYIIRGTDEKGNVFITLANEEKLKKLCKRYPKCSKMLYSAEVTTDIRPLNVAKDNEFNVINLRLDSKMRKIDQPVETPVPNQSSAPPKAELQKNSKSNIFAMGSKPPVKQEKPSPPTAPPVVKVESKAVTPTKASPKQQSPKKDTKKMATGKGAISSFFSAKPTQMVGKNGPVKQELEDPPIETAPEKEHHQQKATIESESTKKPGKTRKRTITEDEATEEEEEDVIPNTPQEEKTRPGKNKRIGKQLLQRKKTTNPSKKSRILEICDSSSEEELDGSEAAERRDERMIQFDEEMTEPTPEPEPEPRKSLSPEKPVENDSNSANRKRAKVKKLVTKTYTDEEGYLITKKTYEMVSEDESEANGTAKEMDAPTKSKLAGQGKAGSIEKKETPPTPKTKQGSIMSFFAKK